MSDNTDYQEYLQSDQWRLIRRIAIEVSNGRCALCDSTESLEVHHRTYANIFDERLADLVVLCDECHGRHHGTLPTVPWADDARTPQNRLIAECERQGMEAWRSRRTRDYVHRIGKSDLVIPKRKTRRF